MFRNLLFLILLFSFSLLSGQTSHEVYAKVRISLLGKDIKDLVSLGVACDCGVRHAHGKALEGVYSESELQLLDDNDWEYEMLIENMAAYRVQNSETPIHFRDVCDGGTLPEFQYPIPENFELGSLGGFLTYQEMLDELDDMAAQYPDLITVKEPISPTLTHEGRPIYWVRISDNANTDEAEPEVFYNAITHAREPGGMIQMIYYMWYLLENYEDNPEMQFLVDNTEMYFVPCINPDGYLFNEVNYGSGNILWRKNRRDNGDGTFGVDLNRNYGHQWGFDNDGSSPETESQTYRGTAPFSEPETQNIRDFCNAHEFKIALNYHTFGNLLIYPWGYSDAATPDSSVFINLSDAMVRENNYFAGTGTETVGYTVNGDSDDWMYGDTTSKPAIYSYTPEVGPAGATPFAGFWPPQDAILDIIQNTVQQNITMAHLVHNVGLATITQGINTDAVLGEIEYSLTKYGLQDAPITVSLEAVSSNLQSIGAANIHNLTIGQEVTAVIGYTLNGDVEFGDEIVMELLVDNGEFIRKETLTATYSAGGNSGTPLLTDEASNFDNWNNLAGTWGLDFQEYVSVPSSITDSPNGNYQDDFINVMVMETVVDLTLAESATLNFWTQWDIEQGWDYAQVMLSADGSNWAPGCGIYSVLGNVNQSFNEPLWDGIQNSWVEESIDLEDYLGGELHVIFHLISDAYVVGDGIYIDDVVVTAEIEDIVQTTEIDNDDFLIYQNRPNPASDYTTIELNNSSNLQNANLIIHNAVGQQVYNASVSSDLQILNLNTSTWSPGVYFYRVATGEEVTKTMRMKVVK